MLEGVGENQKGSEFVKISIPRIIIFNPSKLLHLRIADTPPSGQLLNSSPSGPQTAGWRREDRRRIRGAQIDAKSQYRARGGKVNSGRAPRQSLCIHYVGRIPKTRAAPCPDPAGKRRLADDDVSAAAICTGNLAAARSRATLGLVREAAKWC